MSEIHVLEKDGVTVIEVGEVTITIQARTGTTVNAGRGLLTAQQVAKELSLHPDTVRRMARIGELTPVHVGKREIRFDRSVIDAWKRAHRDARLNSGRPAGAHKTVLPHAR